MLRRVIALATAAFCTIHPDTRGQRADAGAPAAKKEHAFKGKVREGRSEDQDVTVNNESIPAG